MPGFRIADDIFRNAACTHTKVHKIPHAQIDELLRSCSMLFDALDRDDAFQRNLARRLWMLRATILFTLLPFDHVDLDLGQLAETVLGLAVRVPAVAEHAHQINKIAMFLRQHPSNPKHARIIELLDDDHLHGRRTAIITALSPGIVPGWPAAIFDELQAHPSAPTIITSRKVLTSCVFDRIVLPSNGRNCSVRMNYDFNYACRAKVLDVFIYGRENFRPPKRLFLPRCPMFGTITRPDAPAEDMSVERIDGWVNDEFWAAIRNDHGEIPGNVAGPVHEAVVKARYVMFADGRGTFLLEDRKVIEISDLIDGRATVDDMTGRYPRKHASDLEEGDLVVLRLSGSGDYLEKVADGIIRKDGKNDLRQRATDWKSALRAALALRGVDIVAERLRSRGYPLSFPDYVWTWTTDLVIGPRNEGEFRELIEIVAELGQLTGRNPMEYASERWRLMHELKGYQRRAGSLIRQAMLERITELIKSNARIGDFMYISLPDVDAGEMGILRVSAVDRDTAIVPYTKINHFDRIESY